MISTIAAVLLLLAIGLCVALLPLVLWMIWW
jgi:hypothetical protein